ncbi:MAG: hypothetical protein IPN40_00065 [Uliginosibacterium sp.]|nr:hypothetical protein [Uliginosibacterium sp.]
MPSTKRGCHAWSIMCPPFSGSKYGASLAKSAGISITFVAATLGVAHLQARGCGHGDPPVARAKHRSCLSPVLLEYPGAVAESFWQFLPRVV